MSEYAELPWSVEDTIENLKELKEGLQERCIIQNLHGRGEKDAEEVAFDFDRAIKALEEVQKYRAIGTVEECRAAVEKQKAKKMVIKNDNGRPRRACGGCGCFVLPASRFCSKCGQKLDWRNEDE